MAQAGSRSSAFWKQAIASAWLKPKSQLRPRSNQSWASGTAVVTLRVYEPRS